MVEFAFMMIALCDMKTGAERQVSSSRQEAREGAQAGTVGQERTGEFLHRKPDYLPG